MNKGECVLSMIQYRRHQRYGLAHNISAGAPFEAWQGLSFVVTADNATVAAGLFSQLPTMSADGALIFNLTQGIFGMHTFTLHLRDDSGDSLTEISEARQLTIVVNPTNSPPDFKIPDSITVMEGSGAYDKVVGLDIFSPNSVGGSLNVYFEVEALEPQLFLQQQLHADTNVSRYDGLPRMDRQCLFELS